ncbi:MAG: hypothetical protein RLZZ397_1388 [Pseudomonadota bacterium]
MGNRVINDCDNTMHRRELEQWLQTELQSQRFKDYGPNGLQVEGRDTVTRVLCGVTASLALIQQAVEQGADTVLVHHGLFWRGQDGTVKGWMRERLRLLLEHDINLLAYHLPLDAHPVWGNNAQLAKVLNLSPEPLARFGEQDLGWLGTPMQGPTRLADLQAHVEAQLQRSSICVGNPKQMIQRVAWCTGGAQSTFQAAIDQGVDLYITGEISEPQAHWARESGVAYLACGHHATERYGVQALGQAIHDQWGIETSFVDIDNPA